jgi:plasmid stabilization system protein ParE
MRHIWTLPKEWLSTTGKAMALAISFFYHRIFEDIDSLSDTAGIHEKHFGYHRKIASRHPFLIYYRMITTGVEVVAVLDGRSRPSDIDALLQRR